MNKRDLVCKKCIFVASPVNATFPLACARYPTATPTRANHWCGEGRWIQGNKMVSIESSWKMGLKEGV